MEPLITNRLDPALFRTLEKRGSEREATPQRRRSAKAAPAEENAAEDDSAGATRHDLDDLA